LIDQPPGGAAPAAGALSFPRVTRPSRAALVALPVAAAARDAYAYVFGRAAGLEPNPSFDATAAAAPADPATPTDAATPADPADPHRHHEETAAPAAAGGTS
jgi:hypothetical protein